MKFNVPSASVTQYDTLKKKQVEFDRPGERSPE